MKIDISSYESLNKAEADILQRLRELQYALSVVQTISLGHHLRLGLITTEELLNKAADISLSAAHVRLKPGDMDLITGLVVKTEDEQLKTFLEGLPAPGKELPIAVLKDRS